MIDWNKDGKVDGIDLAITSALLDDDEKKPSGCCGPTAAIFLMCIITPALLVVHLLR